MRLDRSGNAKRNIAFGAANKVAFIVLPFITRTVMKQAIGVGYLGLNGLFSSILSVLSLAEMGFSSAIVYNMYRPVAEGDGAAIGALLNYYRRIYRRVGLAILLAGLALLPFLPRLVRGEVPGDVSLYALYLVYLGNTSLFDAVNQIEQQVPDGPEIRNIIKFMRETKLGVIAKM